MTGPRPEPCSEERLAAFAAPVEPWPAVLAEPTRAELAWLVGEARDARALRKLGLGKDVRNLLNAAGCAANYLSIDIVAEDTGEEFTVLLQRKAGKSPAEKAADAETLVAGLREISASSWGRVEEVIAERDATMVRADAMEAAYHREVQKHNETAEQLHRHIAPRICQEPGCERKSYTPVPWPTCMEHAS